MIRHIIWDVGGTLFDTYPAMAEAFRRALADFGVEEPPADLMTLLRVSRRHCAQVLAERYGLDEAALYGRYSVHYHAIGPEAQPPREGVEAVLRYIVERGGMNFIVTHRSCESAYLLLEIHGLRHYFTEVVSCERRFPRKPNPAACLYLVEKYGLVERETLSVGDRDVDVRAGRNAGLRTAYVGPQPHEVKAEIEVSDMAALLKFIRAENEGVV